MAVWLTIIAAVAIGLITAAAVATGLIAAATRIPRKVLVVLLASATLLVLASCVGAWLYLESLVGTLRFVESETVRDDSERLLVITTCAKVDALFGLPVWTVTETSKADGSETALFTVEREFQESAPGYPTIKDDPEEIRLADSAESYVFSVRDRKFHVNKYPESVYVGAFQRRE